MKRILPLLLLLFALARVAQAQTVLIEEHIDSVQPLDSEERMSYYNRTSFFSARLGIGLSFDPQLVSEGAGMAWSWGFFYKHKLSNVFALVADGRLSGFNNNYSLLENNSQGFEFTYRRSKWLMSEFGLGPRVNLDPNRGNRMGLYISSEAFVGYVLDNRIKERYILPGATRETQTSSIVGFGTNTNWTYGLSFTLGYEQHALNVQYRISSLVGNSNAGVLQGYENMQVSPMLITYQLGFF